MMKVNEVKFINFENEEAHILQEIDNSMKIVTRSSTHILGENVIQFEKEWAKYLGVFGAVGVGNGLDALEICLRNAGVGDGDEVITTPLTAFATTLAILKVGAVPVYADINSNTGLMSMDSAKRCLSMKTKVVLLVHLYGFLDNIDQWKNWCDESRIILIEDCAQSHGAKFNGQMSGSFGQSAAFSFYPTKNLGAIGDAGCVVSNSREITEQARIMRNYGQAHNYEVTQFGLNSRLDEIQAAILNVKLKYLENNIKKRQSNAQKYFNCISNGLVELLKKPEDIQQHAYHLFVLKVKSRSSFMAYLKSYNIQSVIHYPILCFDQKFDFTYRKDPEGTANATLFGATCISIPISHLLSGEEQNYIIEVINKYEK